MRVGYGAFPSWLMPTLWAAKQPYNLNVAANAAALASLYSLPELEKNVKKLREERDRLYTKLGQIDSLEPVPSEANFILCKVINRDAYDLTEKLKAAGIFVRYYDTALLNNFIRISVGLPQQTDTLIQVLENLK